MEIKKKKSSASNSKDTIFSQIEMPFTNVDQYKQDKNNLAVRFQVQRPAIVT